LRGRALSAAEGAWFRKAWTASPSLAPRPREAVPCRGKLRRGRVATVIGKTIDRYRVVEKLGEGGMGVVYRARDTLLGRFVALKALPPKSASDTERRDRFLAEAKAASALQHPGIVSVFDVVHAEGQDFIVMEYLPGETLEQRMGQRALSLSRGLRYGEQVADALACAHAAGIVHRDLKPSNVMVTEDDTVKILDFGLAKLAEAPFPDDEAPTVSLKHRESPTRDGALVGTLAYMSPEQAAGRPVDARSDVFSFGVLLYEMLTGRHPFRRGSQIETLSAIREAEPERPTRVASGLPPEAERAILRCLHKDPSRRWQSMADLSAVLRDLREDSESGRARGAGTPAGARRSRAWWWATIAGLVLSATATFLLYGRLARLTFDNGVTADPTISADGKLVAYASDRSGEGHLDIWVQHVNEPHPARLTRHAADDWQPSISPDGSRIAFRSERDGGGIYVVGTLGGEERKIADRGAVPRFSPDGSRIAYVEETAWRPRGLYGMFVAPVEGGPPRPFQPDFGTRSWPIGVGPLWSPDGRHLLFSGARAADERPMDWWVAPVDGGEAVSTGAASALPATDVMQWPCAWVGRHVLFAKGATMEGVNQYRAHISSGDFRVTGPPEALTSGTGISYSAAVANDGRLLIPRSGWVTQLWAIELDSRNGTPPPPVALTRDGAQKFGLSLARSAARLAYSAFTGPRGQRRTEVLLRDLASGEETTPIQTHGRLLSASPHLSADGALVTWEDDVGGKATTFVARAGESTGRELCRNCRVHGFFADAGHVLARIGPARLARLDLESGAETPLLELEDGAVLDADVSWDDRWLAVAIGRPDGTVLVEAIPVGERATSPSEWIPIVESPRWLASPRWAPDGRRIYFMANRDGFRCIWAQALDPATKRPRGEPAAVFHAHRNPWRMTGPGTAFSLAVGRDLLVFNAAEITGNVLMGRLPPD
jgi:Tol biopolymer transport system component/predicted Ser/Thr protein kinase